MLLQVLLQIGDMMFCISLLLCGVYSGISDTIIDPRWNYPEQHPGHSTLDSTWTAMWTAPWLWPSRWHDSHDIPFWEVRTPTATSSRGMTKLDFGTPRLCRSITWTFWCRELLDSRLEGSSKMDLQKVVFEVWGVEEWRAENEDFLERDTEREGVGLCLSNYWVRQMNSCNECIWHNETSKYSASLLAKMARAALTWTA